MICGSGDGSLTHFFVDSLDDSIAYACESGQLTNPNPIYKGRLKNLITLLTFDCLYLTDIRVISKQSWTHEDRFRETLESDRLFCFSNEAFAVCYPLFFTRLSKIFPSLSKMCWKAFRQNNLSHGDRLEFAHTPVPTTTGELYFCSCHACQE